MEKYGKRYQIKMIRFLRHKFNAKRTEHNGINYASRKEAMYAAELDIRVKSGEVIFYLTQVPLRLPGGVKYVCDFLEFRSDGTAVFVDVKGHRTKEYIMKKKIIESIYPIEIMEV
jgi:hypothetical protein